METGGTKRRKPRQLELGLVYGVTREMACIMCHLSSECEGCCLKCDKPCGGQTCSQPTRDHEYNRFMTWMYLVNTSLTELKRFVPKKYLNEYQRQAKK